MQKNRYSTRTLTLMAMLAAMAYVAMYLTHTIKVNDFLSSRAYAAREIGQQHSVDAESESVLTLQQFESSESDIVHDLSP